MICFIYIPWLSKLYVCLLHGLSNQGSTVSGKKGAAAAPAKAKEEKPAEVKPAVKKWTAQDEAACKIQTKARQFLAKKALERKKKEKQEYHALMDKLEQEVGFLCRINKSNC